MKHHTTRFILMGTSHLYWTFNTLMHYSCLFIVSMFVLLEFLVSGKFLRTTLLLALKICYEAKLMKVFLLF